MTIGKSDYEIMEKAYESQQNIALQGWDATPTYTPMYGWGMGVTDVTTDTVAKSETNKGADGKGQILGAELNWLYIGGGAAVGLIFGYIVAKYLL